MKKQPETIGLEKPTYSAVLDCQNTLKELLDVLIKENRALSPREKKDYFLLFPSATLGEGADKPFRIFLNGKIYHLGTVERIGRLLGDQNDSKIWFKGDYGDLDTPVTDINVFWKKLLEYLYELFPYSLDKALSMSKEIEKGKTGQGYRVS
jgi:hypothetical protein